MKGEIRGAPLFSSFFFHPAPLLPNLWPPLVSRVSFFRSKVLFSSFFGRFHMPLSVQDKEYAARLAVRGQYVHPDLIEDVHPRPNTKMKRKMGGKIGLGAAVVGGTPRVFFFIIPRNKWNSKTASSFYKKLRIFSDRHYPAKKHMKYPLLEDNDPSQKTKENGFLKEELNFFSLGLPPRSPDLNPLDFSIWGEVMRKLRSQEQGGGKKKESKKAFVARLRRTVLGLDTTYLRKVMRSMKTRLRKCHEKNGGRFEK